MIAPERMPRLGEYVGGIIRELGGQMLAANGPADHMHIVTILNQKLALMDVLKTIKANSSGWVHETFPDMQDFAWQDGYAAFTVSHSATEQVVEYVRRQAEHHRKMSFQEELIELLKRHGVEYDERYIWK